MNSEACELDLHSPRKCLNFQKRSNIAFVHNIKHLQIKSSFKARRIFLEFANYPGGGLNSDRLNY